MKSEIPDTYLCSRERTLINLSRYLCLLRSHLFWQVVVQGEFAGLFTNLCTSLFSWLLLCTCCPPRFFSLVSSLIYFLSSSSCSFVSRLYNLCGRDNHRSNKETLYLMKYSLDFQMFSFYFRIIFELHNTPDFLVNLFCFVLTELRIIVTHVFEKIY